MVLTLYTMAFVVGPALFLLMSRREGRLWPPALVASFLVVLSLALRKDAALTLGVGPTPLFFSVFLIWMAWIVVLVMVAGAVRRTFPGLRARRVVRALGAMGTTVPWFGFATAQMMAD